MENFNEKSEKMKALYDAVPYPIAMEGKTQQNNLLLTHWINAVSPNGKALSNSSRILVAGCGTGEEGLMLAQLFPEAEVLGIDFSEISIQRAQELLEKSGLKNLNFEVGDLMSKNCCYHHKPFDFILCYGVADYVKDPQILMDTFKRCLSEDGVLCLTVNSPNHPAGRIREAFRELGILPEDFVDSTEQRALLRLVDKMIGESGLSGIGNAPKTYLNVDIFAPIAHHNSMEVWSERAENSGLLFAGSIDALLGVQQMTDEELPLVFSLDKASLSLWLGKINTRPGIQMLFTKNKISEPSFDNFNHILEWKPVLDTCVGTLPEMTGDWDVLKKLTVRFNGFTDLIINSTAFDLEVLRRCKGVKSLGEIIANIEFEYNRESLLSALFRAYHYGLLL